MSERFDERSLRILGLSVTALTRSFPKSFDLQKHTANELAYGGLGRQETTGRQSLIRVRAGKRWENGERPYFRMETAARSRSVSSS